MKSITRTAVIVGIGFLLSSGTAQSAMTAKSAEQMMKSGQSMKCSFKNWSENGQQSGTMFFAKGKMRGNFEISQDGYGSFASHMIRDDEWQYVWGGPMGQNRGFKSSVSSADGFRKKSKTFDTDEVMDMDCEAWSEDKSFFVPPADIDFSDMTQNLRQVQQATADMNQIKCSACDQIPDPQGRQKCREMMGCS
ncbi:MAG: hypothetical protein KC649_01955 [Candidatus Omnitrophica bacterium]|nr:hypothetical protein [Candidatus Omnitrophota bacterium]